MQRALADAGRLVGPGMHRSNSYIELDPIPVARVDGVHRWLCSQELVANPVLDINYWEYNGGFYVKVDWFPAVTPETPILRPQGWHTSLAMVKAVDGVDPLRGVPRRDVDFVIAVLRHRWGVWQRRMTQAVAVPGATVLHLGTPDSAWSWNMGLQGVERAACQDMHRLAKQMLSNLGVYAKTPAGGLHISWYARD